MKELHWKKGRKKWKECFSKQNERKMKTPRLYILYYELTKQKINKFYIKQKIFVYYED